MSSSECLEVEVLESGEYEFEKFVRALEGSPYSIGKDKIWKIGKKSSSPISNFIPIVDEQINKDNGKDITTTFNVRSIIIESYKKLPTINVTKQELENFSFVLNSEWKLNAIISAGQGNQDRLREITQIISKEDVKCKTIYTHIGFRRINNKLVYLYHGGYIGDLGDEEIDVDLSDDKIERYAMTYKEFELVDALSTTYSILDVADTHITIPLLATTYLAPLTSLLKEVDINADYVLWVEGKSGSRKSSLVAVLLSHFGKFTRDDFVCSFRDTLNNIEKKAFLIKDSINVVDDYNPETLGNKKTEIAEKLFAMYGDRVGRGRMSSDGMTLKSPYVARGLCICTGESFPNVAQSRLARAIVVDVKKDSIDLNKLTELQENTPKLAFSMKKYIEWVIQNEDDIKSKAKQKMKELQAEKRNINLHGRTNEAINVMLIGFINFLEFLMHNQFIVEEQKQELEKMCHATLLELVEQQTLDIEDTNPVQMFISALEQLYMTERIYLKDYHYFDKTNYDGVYVGMVDNDTEEGVYYFLPDVIYKEVVKFYKEQEIKFPISKPALWKYLDTEGYLYKTAKSTRRTVRRKIPDTDDDVPFIPILQHKMGNIYLKPKYKEVV